MIEFPTGEKTAYGYLALPQQGSGPGVILLHAWWGLNDFFKSLCDRLAAKGFTVLAPDLFDGQTAVTIAEAERLAEQLEFETARRIALGAVDFLEHHPVVHGKGLGALGFSLGGAWAILLSTLRPQAIRAAVIFYGAYAADFSESQAAYLGHFSDDDEWEPVEGVREMEAGMVSAGREVTIHFYPGVKHWFFEADRPEYDPQASDLAWARTVAFLTEHLTENGSRI